MPIPVLRPVTALLVVALATVLVTGCAPQLDRIELSVQENRDTMAEMKASNRRLSQEVAALANLLRFESEAGDETNAQRFAKLGQVALRLEQLLQKLDDNAAYMRELSARVDLLATRSGIPTIGEYKPPPPGAGVATAILPEEGRSIYQAAQLDRSRGNLDMAREGFQDFLDRFGMSELGDDARYWLGDLAYGEEDWATASRELERLLVDHPQTSLAPAALLKLGYCLREQGKPEAAEAVLQDLRTRFPESNEAALVSQPDQ